MSKTVFDLQLFAENRTMLSDMVNPEVMGDMISTNLPKAIKFAKIAKIDTTLQGQPGSTITVPRFVYIGDAKDVAEGAAIEVSKLTTSTTQATIKKAAKGVEITDEAVLSGYGDMVGESVNQINMAIASKMDDDIVAALNTATITLDKSTETISYTGIVDAVDKFAEEINSTKVLFIHPKQLTQIRKSEDFIDKNKYGGDLMMSGAIGSICGCEVVSSLRVPNSGGMFTNFLVQISQAKDDGTPGMPEVTPAVTLYLKRDVNIESDRDILHKTTVISADAHYTANLSNPARVIKVTFKEA